MTDEREGSQPLGAGSALLGQFTLDLAKAMLRTGYYTSDHPQAKQSLETLPNEFRATVGEGFGLTFLVGKKDEAEIVMVQGHDDEPQTLDHIMIRGMADLFGPKLLDFFHRRRLVSFSLRPSITPEELTDFVVLMSEPPRADAAGKERERVERFFLDRHIINVSTVFQEDILGQERRLPWRVKLALSRLGRDLRTLPLYAEASPEELQRIKMEIIDDVTRPLRDPHLVMELLLNCDLLAAGIKILGKAEIEEEIVGQIPTQRLNAACQEIVRDMGRPEPEADGDSTGRAQRRQQVLRHGLMALVASGIDLDSGLVEACVKAGAATFEELPKGLRTQLKRRRALDTFLVRKEEYLETFAAIPSGERGSQLVRTAEVLYSECLNRELYVEAAGILNALRTGSHQGGEGAPIVEELVESLRAAMAPEAVHGPLLDRLAEADLPRPESDALVELISFTGQPASPNLIRAYSESDRREVRVHLFNAIRGIGPATLVPFLTRLSEAEEEWPAIHHVLASLAGYQHPELAKPMRPFLEHENPNIRHVALTRMVEILGIGAEDVLIPALRDPHPLVRHAAVAYLGRLGSRHPEALAFVMGALEEEHGADPPEASDEVLVECCRSLAMIAETSPDRTPEIERLLLGALSRADHGGLLGRLRRGVPRFSEKVRLAICAALGSLGTGASLEALAGLASGESAVAEASLAAAERIRKRTQNAR